jgi:site-specific DNA-methyltransferase (adenine-specific)
MTDIVSKQRVVDHGEVFTGQREVQAMLDLVPQETERLESRFLEPACGTGNFLAEILERKLGVAGTRYGKNPAEHQRHIFLAVSSIYAVDLIRENVIECRRRLAAIVERHGKNRFHRSFMDVISFVLDRNIVHGNGLTLRTATDPSHPVILSEWTLPKEEPVRWKDVVFRESTFCAEKAACRMKFDVVIGNPPYQLDDGGFGRSASPLYHKFIRQAKKLGPRYLVMIVPSRWFAGGKGLDGFRAEMLADRRIRKLVDYENASDIFPGVDVAGGICYFLWDRDHPGLCEVTSAGPEGQTVTCRPLDEFPVFVRQSRAVPILRKVLHRERQHGRFLNQVISSRKPFGLPTNYQPAEQGVPCWFTQKTGRRFACPGDIRDDEGRLNKWKLLIPPAPIAGQTDFSRPIAFYYEGNTRIASPGECCTESWLVACAFATQAEVLSFRSYLFTKIARFLLLQAVVSQHVTREKFVFVPDMMDYSRPYTDALLCKRWGFTDEEWAFIDSRIRDAGTDRRRARFTRGW